MTTPANPPERLSGSEDPNDDNPAPFAVHIISGPEPMLIAIIVVSILLIVLFIGVSVAGGRAHDRANVEAERRERQRAAAADEGDDKPAG